MINFQVIAVETDTIKAERHYGIGLNGIQTYQGNSAMLIPKYSPYFFLKKNRTVYSFGPTFGKLNILNINESEFTPGSFSVFNEYLVDDKISFNGLYFSSRFYPNSKEKLLNLYLESTLSYLLIKNNLNDKKFQIINSLEGLLKFGTSINLIDIVSINISAGLGGDFKFAKKKYYDPLNIDRQINRIYKSVLLSRGFSVGLEFEI